jgi:hypothetical protein
MRFLRHEFEQDREDELEFESELEFNYSTEIEYKIGDPADAANRGQDPNPHHDSVLAQLSDFVRSSGWGDIRREQTQVAGTISPVQATERAGSRGRGLNFPDLSGVDLSGRRTHIEVDTSATASRDHQDRIFAADTNPALGGVAAQARGVFVVIDPRTGLVTSVRHVRHRQGGGVPVEVVRRYGAGVPMATLLRSGVLDGPISSRSAAIRAARSVRRQVPRRRRQREFEGEWLYYL